MNVPLARKVIGEAAVSASMNEHGQLEFRASDAMMALIQSCADAACMMSLYRDIHAVLSAPSAASPVVGVDRTVVDPAGYFAMETILVALLEIPGSRGVECVLDLYLDPKHGPDAGHAFLFFEGMLGRRDEVIHLIDAKYPNHAPALALRMQLLSF